MPNVDWLQCSPVVYFASELNDKMPTVPIITTMRSHSRLVSTIPVNLQLF